MAGLLPGDPSQHGMVDSGSYSHSQDKQEEHNRSGGTWYFSRKEIEDNSPSRRDGIDLKKEAYLRKSYCTFLQDLGMRLKVPQVTIATAIIFCHRFFLRQSHAKNDRRTIATVCMFLAGKVEETPRPLKDVIIVSYEIIHKKDPVTIQRIKQREVYEQQKELILLGERVVLATLGFDLNVHHPYKPLVEAIKKFKVAQNALAQVAWNFVNDGLRTSLCLQFKPHHIAAGAIFLAAKFLKVKLPSDGERVWWQEFDVTPRQLEEVSNQMLELYEQNRAAPAGNGNETEGNSAGAPSRAPVKSQGSVEEPAGVNGHSQASVTGKHANPMSSRQATDLVHIDKQTASQRAVVNDGKELGSRDMKMSSEHRHATDGNKDYWHHESGNNAEPSNGRANYSSDRYVEDAGKSEGGGKLEGKERHPALTEGSKGYSPNDAIKKIDKDKVKAALEKRRKAPRDFSRKVDVMDEDDLIERELESGVELAVEDEKSKQERKHNWSKPLHRHEESIHQDYAKENGGQRVDIGSEGAEEGELSIDDHDFQSPEQGRKRKHPSPDRQLEGKEGFELQRRHQYSHTKYHGNPEDGRNDRFDRDYKKHG